MKVFSRLPLAGAALSSVLLLCACVDLAVGLRPYITEMK